MKGTSKFVALMLMMAMLFASPALAFASCWTAASADESGMKCPPDCPMMADCDKAQIAFSVPDSSPCCQMSSGKSAPAEVPQVPVSPATASPVNLNSAEHMLVSVQLRASKSVPHVLLPEASPQALLCTFLV